MSHITTVLSRAAETFFARVFACISGSRPEPLAVGGQDVRRAGCNARTIFMDAASGQERNPKKTVSRESGIESNWPASTKHKSLACHRRRTTKSTYLVNQIARSLRRQRGGPLMLSRG